MSAAVLSPAPTGRRERVVTAVRSRRSLVTFGALASVLAALGIYTRYSIYGSLSRDESIYVYGGQRMAHGTPPYVSIFDPKSPLATMICGFGAALGRLLNRDSILLIRLLFFGCALLTVLAVYLLVLQLWHSVLGALAAAVTFASFKGFAQDALPGPDAKTPGILFAVLAMWLAVRRQWFLAAFASSLAFLVWQPLFFYPLMVMVAAVVLAAPQRRWFALAISAAGAAIPLALVFAYFAAEGAVGTFMESAFQFPLEGVHRGHQTVTGRIAHIARVVRTYYDFSGVLFAVGLVLIAVLVVAVFVRAGSRWLDALRDPLVLIVLLTLLGEAAYACSDFQSYPDLFPLLPYPAVGLGGAVAMATRLARRPAAMRAFAGATLVAALALTGLSCWWFSHAKGNNEQLRAERATACAVNRVIVPGTRLYALGDPMPLAMTYRRNPDRFIFLGSGVAAWKIKHHLSGDFGAWTDQVATSGASVIVIQGWYGSLRRRMGNWLVAADYPRGYIGQWRIFMTHEARIRAAHAGILITHVPTKRPQTTDGSRFTCTG